jgi:hypothetical protein
METQTGVIKMEATIIKTGAKVLILETKVTDAVETMYLIAPVGSPYATVGVAYVAARKVSL